MLTRLKNLWRRWFPLPPPRCPKILGKVSQCIHDLNHDGPCHIDASQMAQEMELSFRQEGHWDPSR